MKNRTAKNSGAVLCRLQKDEKNEAFAPEKWKILLDKIRMG